MPLREPGGSVAVQVCTGGRAGGCTCGLVHVCLGVHLCRCVQVCTYGWGVHVDTGTHTLQVCTGVHRSAYSRVGPCVGLCMPVHRYRWECTCVQAPVAVALCGCAGVVGIHALQLCIHVSVPVCGCTCVYRCTCVCVCVWLHPCASLYLCLYGMWSVQLFPCAWWFLHGQVCAGVQMCVCVPAIATV